MRQIWSIFSKTSKNMKNNIKDNLKALVAKICARKAEEQPKPELAKEKIIGGLHEFACRCCCGCDGGNPCDPVPSSPSTGGCGWSNPCGRGGNGWGFYGGWGGNGCR